VWLGLLWCLPSSCVARTVERTWKLPTGNMITMKRFDEATPVRVARAFGYPGPVLDGS
jgi:hypothetical protein